MENTNLSITLSPDGYYTYTERMNTLNRAQVIKLLKHLKPELQDNTIQSGITSLLKGYYRYSENNFIQKEDYIETRRGKQFTGSGIKKILRHFKLNMGDIEKG